MAGESTLQGQLTPAVFLAVVWAVVFESAVPSIKRRIEKAAWWPGAVPQVKSMMYGWGFPQSPTANFRDGTSDEMAAETYAMFVVTCCHHVLSCLLILPVLFWGWQQSSGIVRGSFFLGTLSDVGLDLYDTAKRVLTLPAVRQACPALQCLSETACPEKFFIVVVVLHHLLVLSLMVPMNMYYPHLACYHQVFAALSGAAGVCYSLVLYKFTINAASRQGLLICKAISVLQFLTMVYTRGLIWFSQAWAAIAHFHSQGDLVFLTAGCAGGFLMTLFNVMTIVDATKAVAKWLPKQSLQVVGKTVAASRARDSGCRARFSR